MRSLSLPCRARNILTLLLVGLLALAVPACGDGAEDIQAAAEGGTTADLPDWLQKVYPAPGAETTATRSVQVDYEVMGAGQEVRLVIDGTDVTTYATSGPGLLEYDIDQANAPVEIEPGSHSATVELYDVEVGASEGTDSYDASERKVIDSFSWDFTVS